jgi:rhodanese-related sulfurtransferase
VQQGYDAVNLDGGMFAWASAGRAVVCDAGDRAGVVL